MRTWRDDVAEDMAQEYRLLRVMGRSHKNAMATVDRMIKRECREVTRCVRVDMDKINFRQVRKRF
jgi:hypothetical protein